jgi:hypothetical protein
MLHILISKLKPRSDILAGAGIGEAHRGQIVSSIVSAENYRPLVVLDFKGIQAVTASYLKPIVPIFYASDSVPAERSPYPLYANLSASAEDDLHHFLMARAWPGIVADFGGGRIRYRKIIGALQATPNETLRRLSKIGSGTANDLMQSAHGTDVALTAWNNRLAELARLRLAKREKRGRFWIYQPIVEVTSNG